MLIGNDTLPRVLSTRNEDHRAGLSEVAINRDGPTFRAKAGNKAASVIHREMEVRQQGLGMQASFLERRTKPECGRRI